MLSKILYYYRKLNFVDFLRKVVYFFLQTFEVKFFKRFRSRFYFKNNSLKMGRGIIVKGLPYNIQIGTNVQFYDKCIFEFSPNSKLKIGNEVVFSFGVILSCKCSINIGSDVQVGEYSSIRDSTHRYDVRGKPMKYVEDILSSIEIGNNVWIGRGCIILPGTIIEDGVVIGANSVVKGHLKTNWIYAGAPVTAIKKIE